MYLRLGFMGVASMSNRRLGGRPHALFVVIVVGLYVQWPLASVAEFGAGRLAPIYRWYPLRVET